jgi:hypothetical protein
MRSKGALLPSIYHEKSGMNDCNKQNTSLPISPVLCFQAAIDRIESELTFS